VRSEGAHVRPREIYFVSDDDALGTMAEKALADRRRLIELPDDVDVVKEKIGARADVPGVRTVLVA